MLEYYPTLIESAIEFKIEYNRVMAQHKREEFKDQFDDKLVELVSDQFELKKDNETDYIFCCKIN